jgi:hypothetical protein
MAVLNHVVNLLDGPSDLEQHRLMLLCQLLELLQAFLKALDHGVMSVAGLLTCFQTVPLDRARQGAPDAPSDTHIT